MGFRINTNMPSLQAQTPARKIARETQESSAKLASGERITKAADDAAGLAISEKLKAEIRSSRQANRNANDGLSLVQTAEGGLNESSSLLTRMRELAIQASSDTLGNPERAKANIEYQQAKLELERISKTTNSMVESSLMDPVQDSIFKSGREITQRMIRSASIPEVSTPASRLWGLLTS